LSLKYQAFHSKNLTPLYETNLFLIENHLNINEGDSHYKSWSHKLSTSRDKAKIKEIKWQCFKSKLDDPKVRLIGTFGPLRHSPSNWIINALIEKVYVNITKRKYNHSLYKNLKLCEEILHFKCLPLLLTSV